MKRSPKPDGRPRPQDIVPEPADIQAARAWLRSIADRGEWTVRSDPPRATKSQRKSR